MWYENGDFYEGEWKAGMRHGKGSTRYSSGDCFDGTYIRDHKEGTGVLTY